MPNKYQRLPNIEAYKHFDGKTLLTSNHYAEIWAYEHALAFTVARIANQDMLSEVHQAVHQAIDNGTSFADFADFKKTLKSYLMAKGWLAPSFKNDNVDDDKVRFDQYQKHIGHRLRTIYHTNKSTAYAAGRWQRIQRTKQAFPYLQYMPSLSSQKRDEHKGYYGLVRLVDDPIWQSIFPPNGYGCKCWVKQLTKNQAQKVLDEQAEKGIVYDIKMEKVKHPLTGETISTPKGVHFSFNHNHDRLSAMLRLYDEKLVKWQQATGLDIAKTRAEFDHALNRHMLNLIFEPDFNHDIMTVVGKSFDDRFHEMTIAIQAQDANRNNSMALRKQLAVGDKWVIATLSTEIQKQMDVSTRLIWLSDDTMIKMIAHHPELDLLSLFKDTAFILKNAVRIIKENDLNVVYYSLGNKYYKTVIKSTKDKKELYLTTIFKMDEKEFYRVIN